MQRKIRNLLRCLNPFKTFSDQKIIRVSKDFSEHPTGRYSPRDGEFTGEKFRETLLVPSLKRYNKTVVILDNKCGYGTPFLNEAFAGLNFHFQKDYLKKHLKILSTSENDIYAHEAWCHIFES